MNTLRFLIRSTFSLVALWLLLVFFIRVFSPGNVDTEAVFKLIALVQPFLDAGTFLLIWPVQAALDWILPYLPHSWHEWFPVTQAAVLFEWLGTLFLKLSNLAETDWGRSMAEVRYKDVFPGILDWRLMLAIGFWGWIESLLLKLVITLEAKLYRQHIRQRDADILHSLRDKQ
jgi:hypothetical protein